MDRDIIFEILDNSEYLPDLPENVSEILDLLKNPVELDIDILIEKVSQSGELNKLMLKNLNTGYFQLHKEIKSIKEAVIYLGMQTVQNLLIFFITLQLFPKTKEKKSRTFNMHHYWKHVLGTSVAGSMLSSRMKIGDKYKIFSYGLIHDIGIITLDTCLPDLIDEITEKLKNGVHQLVAERIAMGGITHADIGAWICRRWNIREDITNIVEFHHTPFAAKSNFEEVQLIYVADVISTEYYEKLLGLNLNHTISKKAMGNLGLTEDNLKEVIEEFPSELEKVAHYFSFY
ncbi:HD-like signal output (HDOD) protein [Mobilisporobacter senegalensis]|uniref:HD-like signal output (HDOD) protein n=1 Tax=Mobilisporobacter senegalensis TaxID=1329262 RepID=A0A3N1X9J7_9FIRM|nr:HDOD domain-containing protein [Mobilisporobacter senegalensis]ROR23423.1 HD-like signal output (HDOD) protein [Mobilisporobacter senegalensis]